MTDFFYEWKREDVWKIIDPTVTRSKRAAVKAEFEKLPKDQKGIYSDSYHLSKIISSGMIRDGGPGPGCSMIVDSILVQSLSIQCSSIGANRIILYRKKKKVRVNFSRGPIRIIKIFSLK